MSLTFSISLSGLDAARRRLEVSASNVANAGSAGALPDAATGKPGTPAPFQPLQVEQQPLPGGGTTAVVSPLDPTFVAQFAPDQPFADQQGLVADPNVDLVSERLNQLSAINAYRANLRVLQVAKDLEREAIDTLGRPSHDLSA
jgi:flagellar basal-body rod protein FlgC